MIMGWFLQTEPSSLYDPCAQRCQFERIGFPQGSSIDTFFSATIARAHGHRHNAFGFYGPTSRELRPRNETLGNNEQYGLCRMIR